MTEPYLYAIAALLPLTASILIFQANPYNALILRGIVGALAALIYAILGAADVALTEALMGTLLAITLYAVAVRSSMVMRLGLLNAAGIENNPGFDPLVNELRTILGKQYLRLELVFYQDSQTLQQALDDREIHTLVATDETDKMQPYQVVTRIRSLYEIIKPELSAKAFIAYKSLAATPSEPTEKPL
jgi:putative multicomponent Na+:H+ antiporter subunit B